MKKRSDLSILLRMLKELGSLTPIMMITILCGVGGYIAASSIAIFTSVAATSVLKEGILISFSTCIIIIILSAVFRGIFRYFEQLSGHYIAFKILAIIRDKVFGALRKLAPAKLDTKEKGNLVSIITSDIEMMEVFYAHTIAPVAIAIVTSIIFIVALTTIHFSFGLLALISYILIGLILPIILKKMASQDGDNYRKNIGKSNSYFFDSLRGLNEIIYFNNKDRVKETIRKNSDELYENGKRVKKHEGLGFALTDALIVLIIFIALFLGYYLYINNSINLSQLIVSVIMIASSFGSVVALSALSTTLAGTIASARRVFEILDEKPVVDEIDGEKEINEFKVTYQDVSFSYPERKNKILKDVYADINERRSIAIMGSSGSGKSTILKLLMRFYDVDGGRINIGSDDTRNMPTSSLRDLQSFVSQNTVLFNDTLENNIRLENTSATKQDVIEAAKKAAIHEFIIGLPEGYDTKVGELGERLSSGERQRIALARVFLKKSDMILLDEPTSNLDILNEAQILKSIKSHCKDKTVVLVSHRESTTSVCDSVLRVEDGRVSKYKKIG
jgi:ATP-binding cassette subfamily C protein